MIYVDEIHKKNYKAIAAALMLYSVHWLYEIANAVICHFSGYALWTFRRRVRAISCSSA